MKNTHEISINQQGKNLENFVLKRTSSTPQRAGDAATKPITNPPQLRTLSDNRIIPAPSLLLIYSMPTHETTRSTLPTELTLTQIILSPAPLKPLARKKRTFTPSHSTRPKPQETLPTKDQNVNWRFHRCRPYPYKTSERNLSQLQSSTD